MSGGKKGDYVLLKGKRKHNIKLLSDELLTYPMHISTCYYIHEKKFKLARLHGGCMGDGKPDEDDCTLFNTATMYTQSHFHIMLAFTLPIVWHKVFRRRLEWSLVHTVTTEIASISSPRRFPLPKILSPPPVAVVVVLKIPDLVV